MVALLVSRLVVWIGGFGELAVWGVFEQHAHAFDPAGLTRPFGSFANTLVAPAVRWDSVWFLSIADGGYAADPNRAAFFPLYPALVALLAPVTGALLAGLLISLGSFFGALALLYRLAERELGGRGARLTVLSLALFPGSFWFSAVYSESLFLLVSVGAVYCARERRWWLAGLCAAAAGATRSAGVLLAIPVALLWWDARRDRERPAPLPALLAAPAPLAGLLAVSLAFERLGLGFGAPFDAQQTWHRALRGPWAGIVDGTSAAWDGIRQLLHGPPPPLYFTRAVGDPMAIARHNLLLWLTLVVSLVMLVGAWRRLRPAHAAYATAALMLPLSYPVAPQPLMSMPRFVSVLYPLFLWSGWWLARRRTPVVVVVLALAAAALAVVSALFTGWRWVA